RLRAAATASRSSIRKLSPGKSSAATLSTRTISPGSASSAWNKKSSPRRTGFRITAVSGAAAEAQFSNRSDGATFGLAIRRAVLDQILLERARRLGALVQTGCRIETLARDDRGWRLKAGGSSWRARFLIGADGRNSWVATQIGAAWAP